MPWFVIIVYCWVGGRFYTVKTLVSQQRRLMGQPSAPAVPSASAADLPSMQELFGPDTETTSAPPPAASTLQHAPPPPLAGPAEMSADTVVGTQMSVPREVASVQAASVARLPQQPVLPPAPMSPVPSPTMQQLAAPPTHLDEPVSPNAIAPQAVLPSPAALQVSRSVMHPHSLMPPPSPCSGS